MTRPKTARKAAANLLPLLALTAAAGVAAWALTQRRPAHPPDSAPGRADRRARFGDYVVTGRTVTIDAPRATLYAMWRDVGELPRFMQDVRSVGPGDDGAWRWRIAGPAGTEAVAETRIVEERPDELLAWRSTPNSEIDTEGKIMLRDAPGGCGTQVSAIIAYRPPLGMVGHWIAKAFRKDPQAQGRHELKRLKMLVETGEIATSANRREA